MRISSALKKSNSSRSSIAYKKAKSVGIIFSVEDKQKHVDIKEFIRQLEMDGKSIQVLEFLPKKKENYEFLFDYFSIQDLTFWGNIESPQAIKFANTQFDYLFYIDKEPNLMVLYLLAISKAYCRIGKYTELESPFFEMMIEQNGTIKNLIENMYKYTKQLK